jgi:hypothetical protein
MRNFGIALLGMLLLGGCGGGAKGVSNADGGPGGSGGQSDAGVEAPPVPQTLGPPPFVVDLALNDATTAQAPRGWPLILTGVAALWTESAAPVSLPASAMSLKVGDASQQVQTWPLAQVKAPAPGAALDAEHRSVQVAWVLTPAQTSALALGTYEVQLTWAGQSSPPLAVEIVEAPTGLGPGDAAMAQARLANLTAQAALLQNDAASALAALNAELVAQPTHVWLLTTQSLAYEAAGNKDEALKSAEAALEQVLLDEPDPDEPVTTWELRNRLLPPAAGGAP